MHFGAKFLYVVEVGYHFAFRKWVSEVYIGKRAKWNMRAAIILCFWDVALMVLRGLETNLI